MVGLRRIWLRRVWGLDIHPTVEMFLAARFDLTYPAGIHISAYSYIAFDARILSHDMTRNPRVHIRIGQNCFIGGRSLILPGVMIGDSCIVGAGSVVTRSRPANSIVAGNPDKTRFGRRRNEGRGLIRQPAMTRGFGQYHPPHVGQVAAVLAQPFPQPPPFAFAQQRPAIDAVLTQGSGLPFAQ